MICPKCGSELNENQKFCTKCGANLTDDSKDNFKIILVTIIAISVVCLFAIFLIATKNSYNSNDISANTEESIVDDTDTQDTDFEPEESEEDKIISVAQEYAYMFDNEHNKVPINFNPRKCLFNVKGVCFGHPFYVYPMSYLDCKNQKDELGLKYCHNSHDIFASTAYVCGGTKYMPTLDELIFLAQDMYNTNTFTNLYDGDCGYDCNTNKATRNNNKEYLNYFRDISYLSNNFQSAYDEQRWRDHSFIIMSNREEFDYSPLIYGRLYYKNSSSLYIIPNYDNGNTSKRNVVSMCVQRDSNYKQPTHEKYPFMQKKVTVNNTPKPVENSKPQQKESEIVEDALF